MLHHLVIVLSLSRLHVMGTGDVSIQNTSEHDELVSSLENRANNALKSDHKQGDLRYQPTTSTVTTTEQYENLNNSVPVSKSLSSTLTDRSKKQETIFFAPRAINLTWTNTLNTRGNSSEVHSEWKVEDDDLERKEYDPAYSAETRIFEKYPNLSANRRSFEYQGNQFGVELLKVGKDVPTVANHPNLHEQLPNSNTNDDIESSVKYSKHKGGQQTVNIIGNYDMEMFKNNHEDLSNDHYYSDDSATAYQEERNVEKGDNSNDQLDVFDYYNHPQTIFTKNEAIISVFPKTNQEINNSSKNNESDTISSPPKAKKSHRFSKPLVITETNHKYDKPSRIFNGAGTNHKNLKTPSTINSEVNLGYVMNNRHGRVQSNEDSGDAFGDSDYVEHTARPRKVEKNNERPGNNFKRLPNEHWNSMEDNQEYEGKSNQYQGVRAKVHRQSLKENFWDEEDKYQNSDVNYQNTMYNGRSSVSEMKNSKSKNTLNYKQSNSKYQVSPNLQILQTSGAEIGQLEKPGLIVPLKFNLLPVTNFDQSNQGFTISNPILHDMVSAKSASRPASIIKTIDNDVERDARLRVFQPVRDSIIRENSVQSSLPPIYPQLNKQQHMYVSSLKPEYLFGTVSPIYAVTPTFNSNLQSVSIQDAQATSAPKSTYVATSQLIIPQTTVQTIPTLVQTPNTLNYIQVNPHGIYGQKGPIEQSTLQVQPFMTMSTIRPTLQTIPVTKSNLAVSNSQSKKTVFHGIDTNFLPSASLSDGQNNQKDTLTNNKYYEQDLNGKQIGKPQVHNSVQGLPNFFLQGTRDENLQHASKNYKHPTVQVQGHDNIGSHSTSNFNAMSSLQDISAITRNVHLPHVETENVEIVNPNIRHKVADNTSINTYSTIEYPTAVLTTEIPVFATTTSFVTARPAMLVETSTEPLNDQNIANSLMEIALKNNEVFEDNSNVYQSQERPMFNPINFVPNIDVVKNQIALNGKLQTSEQLQQNLNLVPLMPGGNFFKPSLSSQKELYVKPKLTMDLKTYADQMFKESLKTIYNSQKLNNDGAMENFPQNTSEISQIATLKDELQRLKASLFNSKRNNYQVEGQYSQPEIKSAELPIKNPGELFAILEQMLKNSVTDSPQMLYGTGNFHMQHKPSNKYNIRLNDRVRTPQYNEGILTPPRLNLHRTKSYVHNKPGYKKPRSWRYYSNHHHFHRPNSHSKGNLLPKMEKLEASVSSTDDHFVSFPQFGNTNTMNQFKKETLFENYPSVSVLSHGKNNCFKHFKNDKICDNNPNIYNHPKIHNLFGLLMRNKQLPKGGLPTYIRNQEQMKQNLDSEKQQMKQHFHNQSLKSYFYKLPGDTFHSNLGYI